MKSAKRINGSKQSRRGKSQSGKVGAGAVRQGHVRDVRQAEETVRPAVRSPRRVRPVEEEGVRQDVETRGTRTTAVARPSPDMSITESDAGTMYRFTTLRGLVIETFVASHKYLRTIDKFRQSNVD